MRAPENRRYRYVSKREGDGEASYQVVFEEARVVRQIFAWVGRDRASIGEVRRRLLREGIPSPRGKSYWDRSTVWAIMDVLPKRFGQYGLTLHPDKTRLVAFRRPDDRDSSSGKPGTFDLLGFTHYWARSRWGKWTVKRKNSSSRLTRALRAIAAWCRNNRHSPVAEQHKTLSTKVRGHCAYYRITGNGPSLEAFRYRVHRIRRYWVSARNRERSMTWDCFNRLLARYPLPATVVVHSVYQPTRRSHDLRNRMR